MKQRIEQMRALARRADHKVRYLWLASALALSGAAQAQSSGFGSGAGSLPTMPAPPSGIGGTTIGGTNDWLGTMGGWIKVGVTIALLALAAYIFVVIVSGAITRWRNYSMGRSDVGEIKEYVIFGVLMAVFVVGLVTYGISILA